jgi:hypothetical protein
MFAKERNPDAFDEKANTFPEGAINHDEILAARQILDALSRKR